MSAVTKAIGDAEHKKLIETLADICARDGITAEALADAKIKALTIDSKNWEAMSKNADGDAVVTALSGSGTRITLSPSWETGPKWAPVQPATLPRITPTKRAARPDDGTRRVLVLPDVHIGFQRNGLTDELVPNWDKSASDVVRVIAKEIRPSQIVQLGDLVDLAEFGSFDVWPAWGRTTQATIQAAGEWWAQWRADFPDAQLQMLAGNHEIRLTRSLIKSNTAAFGLTAARLTDLPQSWPQHSIPAFLQFEKLGVEYFDGYPSNRIWITDNLALIHGDQDPSKKDLSHHHSSLMGHFHRRSERWFTRSDRLGSHLVMQACPGTLSPIDATIPSWNQGIDTRTGLAFPRDGQEGWQQGAGVITVFGSDADDWSYEAIHIHKGRAFFRGRIYGA